MLCHSLCHSHSSETQTLHRSEFGSSVRIHIIIWVDASWHVRLSKNVDIYNALCAQLTNDGAVFVGLEPCRATVSSG